jgi:hypothetical protein
MNDTPPPADDPKANHAAGAGCMTRLVRLCLLPLAFIVELVALIACAVCLAMHFVFPPALKWGDTISDAAMKLPPLKWYWPNNKDG